MKSSKYWRNERFKDFRFLLLLGVFLFFVTGFKACGPPPQPPAQKPFLILVFIDITTSVDGQSIDSVIEKAKNLVTSLPFNSRIVVFPIDNNDFPEKLLDYTIPKCDDETLTGMLKDVADKRCRTGITERIDEFGASIKTKYEDLKQNTSIKQRSCIINTLSKINEFFKHEDKNTYTFEVLYLSDMIEECNSSVGSIYLCSNRRPPVKEDILKEIQSRYNPNFRLKEILDNNISFVITTKILGSAQYKCLFQEGHKEVWRNVFSKVGYSESDFESFPFTSEIPGKFKKLENQPTDK